MESYSDEEDDIDGYEPRKVPETKTSAKAKQPVAQKVKHKMDSNSDSEDFKKSAAASKKSKVVSARTKKPVRAESDDEPETVPKMKPKVLEDKTMRGYSKLKESVPSGRNLRSRITKNKPSKTESSGDEAKGTKSTSRRTIKTEPNKSESEEEQTDVPPVEKRRKKNVSQKSKSKSTLIKKRLSSTRLSIAMAVENKKRPSIKDMVLAAVTALQTERNAVSLPVLKKFIYETYQISPDYQSTYITKAVAKAVENGELINTTGSGANGSFKLGKVVKMKDASSSKKYKMEEGTAKAKTAPATASTRTSKMSKKANY